MGSRPPAGGRPGREGGAAASKEKGTEEGAAWQGTLSQVLLWPGFSCTLSFSSSLTVTSLGSVSMTGGNPSSGDNYSLWFADFVRKKKKKTNTHTALVFGCWVLRKHQEENGGTAVCKVSFSSCSDHCGDPDAPAAVASLSPFRLLLVIPLALICF